MLYFIGINILFIAFYTIYSVSIFFVACTHAHIDTHTHI
jgi:hypothetical protein